jgi:hypothetical protein
MHQNKPHQETPKMTDTSFNTDILAQIAAEDATPGQLATRTAQRIVAKGFELLHAVKVKGYTDGGNWGRSSHYTTHRVIWEIAFLDADDNDHVVNVSCSTTHYTKRNPYDRIPKDNGQMSAVVMATDGTKNALGWKAAA